MNFLTVVVVLTVVSYSSVQSLLCTANPCDLGHYYDKQNGYDCIQVGTEAYCTCPGGNELNEPCRPCNRKNPLNNACSNSSGRLRHCLDTTDFGASYVCVCADAAGNDAFTTDPNCNLAVTATARPTITLPSVVTPPICANGGVLHGGTCHCPSGYAGPLCHVKIDADLCSRVTCKNNGVCALRPIGGPYEAVCLCRYGTWGQYCELNGTLGSCLSGSCLNGGACQENVVAVTRHAYCLCPAGYSGVKCETQYFPCQTAGKFVDVNMSDQGRYFECVTIGGKLQAQHRSCAKGLRFNSVLQGCATTS